MPNALFSKRERLAIAGATVAFILVSAATHLVMGGAIAKWIVFPRPQPEPFATELRWFRFETPTPTPKPPPTHTPPPQHRVRVVRQQPTTEPRQTPYVERPAAAPSAGVVAPTASPVESTLPTSDTPSPAPQASPSQSLAPAVSEIRDGEFIHRVVPSYPSICVEQGVVGTVVIEITIGSDGSVVGARVGQTSGYRCLDDAALAAAKESAYRAPELNGKSVSETYRIIYDFAIDS